MLRRFLVSILILLLVFSTWSLPAVAEPIAGYSSILAMANNQYVCAEDYGNGPLVANRSSASDWESFKVIYNSDGTVSFLSQISNKYVCADLNLGGQLIADRTAIDTWEKFRIVDLGDGTVALLALANNMYVSADLNQGAVLYANRSSIDTWEKFKITEFGGSSPSPDYKTLVWSDEFNGSSLDTSNWTCEIGTGHNGWGNNELQYYTDRPENVRVSGGHLIITARRENYGGRNYTSARIKTQGKRNWTYGRIEARIKIPTGQGLWPAFWMLGESFSQVSWPYCGEIDIMEHINNESVTHGTIHWSDHNGNYAYYGGATRNLDFSQFHVYSIEWSPSSIKWFVDGNQFFEANIANGINGTDEFHKPFFIILNLAVGGNWPGSPNSSTPFPAEMLVDYVRVYQ